MPRWWGKIPLNGNKHRRWICDPGQGRRTSGRAWHPGSELFQEIEMMKKRTREKMMESLKIPSIFFAEEAGLEKSRQVDENQASKGSESEPRLPMRKNHSKSVNLSSTISIKNWLTTDSMFRQSAVMMEGSSSIILITEINRNFRWVAIYQKWFLPKPMPGRNQHPDAT